MININAGRKHVADEFPGFPPCGWAFITAGQQQPQPEATDAVIAGISLCLTRMSGLK